MSTTYCSVQSKQTPPKKKGPTHVVVPHLVSGSGTGTGTGTGRDSLLFPHPQHQYHHKRRTMARTIPISSSPSVLTFCTTLLLALLAIPTPSDSSDYTSFVFGGCSQQKYSPTSPYQSNVDSLLTSLLNSASFSSYNNYTVPGSSADDLVHGLFQCRGDLSLSDCAACVSQAVSRVGTLCSNTCGAAVQLQGCFIKYDNDTFLGVEDKTVVLKKCGPLDGPEPVSRRDAVLADIAGGEGRYRAGESGDVQGFAQCVGDLSPAQCGDCLSNAAGLLSSGCGSAASGDMFLAKCYVRYTAAGGGGGGGGGGSSGSSGGGTISPINPNTQVPTADAGESSSSDEGEKTFAIIIGLFAGVALIIVFAAFIRKVANGNEENGLKS